MLQITTDKVKIMWRYCLATLWGFFMGEKVAYVLFGDFGSFFMRSVIAFSLGCIGLTCA